MGQEQRTLYKECIKQGLVGLLKIFYHFTEVFAFMLKHPKVSLCYLVLCSIIASVFPKQVHILKCLTVLSFQRKYTAWPPPVSNKSSFHYLDRRKLADFMKTQ